MRLSTQLALAIVGVVLVATTALGLYTYHSVETAILPGRLERAKMRTQLLAQEIEATARRRPCRCHRISFDCYRRHRPRHRRGPLDPRDGTTLDQWRAGLATRFAAELAAKPVYTQFRVIGIADGGREIVRVDRSGPHGAIRNVPDGELQRKADSYYFKQAIGLPRAPSMFLRSTSIEDMASSRCRMYRRCGLRTPIHASNDARSAFSSSISICGRYSIGPCRDK